MPYNSIDELPENVRNTLDEHLQKIWMNIFNYIYNKSGDEEKAFKYAWGVVNKIRNKKGGDANMSDEGKKEMGAVSVHHILKIDERAWDKNVAIRELRKWASKDGSGEKDTIDWKKYRMGFAWYDESDPENFTSYKLPHHRVINGRLVVSRRGVISAMQTIFGARGGVDIPKEDLKKVYSHLKAHYEDIGLEPPEFTRNFSIGELSWNTVGDAIEVEGVIFHAGTHTANDGSTYNFSENVVKTMYEELIKNEPKTTKITFEHGGEVIGFATAFSLNDKNELMFKGYIFDTNAIDLIKSGVYKDVSAELLITYDEDGNVNGAVLEDIALCRNGAVEGASLIAVRNVAMSNGNEDEVETIERFLRTKGLNDDDIEKIFDLIAKLLNSFSEPNDDDIVVREDEPFTNEYGGVDVSMSKEENKAEVKNEDIKNEVEQPKIEEKKEIQEQNTNVGGNEVNIEENYVPKDEYIKIKEQLDAVYSKMIEDKVSELKNYGINEPEKLIEDINDYEQKLKILSKVGESVKIASIKEGSVSIGVPANTNSEDKIKIAREMGIPEDYIKKYLMGGK